MLTIDNNYYKFPASISLFDFLLMKFRGQKNRYVFPPLFSTIFRAMLIGSFPKYQQNIRLANYYIHPDFSGYSPIFMEKSSQSETLQLGYESTLAIVKNWNYNAEN